MNSDTVASPADAGKTFGARRRWLRRLDLAFFLLLSAYVLLTVNSIIFRHPLRIDLTSDRSHSLSPATLARLKLVREEIRVVIPTFLQEGNPEHLAQREVLERARRLLQEYMAVQPLIRIAAEVDVFARPQRWLEVREQFDLSGSQVNRFLFFAGPDNEYRQTVTPRDMATFVESPDPRVEPPTIKNFHPEKALTDAITRLVERKKRVLYFTQDKEELTFAPQGGRRQGAEGLSAFVHELATQGYEARELSLAAARSVPADCEVLVIAGPLQPYLPEELEAIRRYLNGGGRLLLALTRPRTGIEDVLGEWGVEVPPGTVRALLEMPGTRTATDRVPFRQFNAVHPATRIFQEVQRFELRLYLSRGLKAGGSEKGRRATVLAETGPGGEGESFFLIQEGASLGNSRSGNQIGAIASQQLVPDRPPPGFQRVDARIVVLGARNILTDEYFYQASHRDFVLNCLAWLLGQEEKATVSGQELPKSMLPMNPSTRRFFVLVPIVLLPAAFLVVAFLVYFIRRA